VRVQDLCIIGGNASVTVILNLFVVSSKHPLYAPLQLIHRAVCHPRGGMLFIRSFTAEIFPTLYFSPSTEFIRLINSSASNFPSFLCFWTNEFTASLLLAALKKCVLELGGSDPFVVLEDADLSHTSRQAAQSRLLNTGQSCIAAKRFIVVKEVAEQFVRLLIKNIKLEVVGDPMNPKTTVGPLVREAQRDTIIR
jgi:Aldehyde dehydrogenase family